MLYILNNFIHWISDPANIRRVFRLSEPEQPINIEVWGPDQEYAAARWGEPDPDETGTEDLDKEIQEERERDARFWEDLYVRYPAMRPKTESDWR